MKSITELASETKNFHCKVCGFDWKSRVPMPKECPACKSRFWKSGITPAGKKAVTTVRGDQFE